ncbi:hypothetical protein GCM10011369_22140 [Neiella marina]|uniref:Antibiotic biosynthesis monooxygenase n=1 Tax=Neiella marina TaxID=508461 RepID=A0A8J2XMM8_9GAMM|nr:antibiotic biosynthesis monooxygenase [Neiella marina]GGA79750.1 hypothetical protein GCM10011369_22140 [Neiella marina]
MYAVIFRAELEQVDAQYSLLANQLRELAFKQYNCIEFTACTEGSSEIAISYWRSLSDITAWKQHSKHLLAQDIGKNRWYKSYQVDVAEISRSYAFDREALSEAGES